MMSIFMVGTKSKNKSTFKNLSKLYEAMEVIKQAHTYTDKIIDNVHEPILLLGSDLKVVTANRLYYMTFKVSREETEGQLVFNLGNRQWDSPKLRKMLSHILPEDSSFENFEVAHNFETIGQRTMLLNARRLYDEGNEAPLIRLAMEDITERRNAEQVAQKAREYTKNFVDTMHESLLVLDAELKVVSTNRSFYRTFKISPEEIEGQFIYDLGNRQWDIPRLRELLEYIISEEKTLENLEVTHDFETVGKRTMLLNARLIYREVDDAQLILLAIEDITERKTTLERINQLNLLIQSIRNTNRLITKEKNRDKLLKGFCNHFIEARGYHYAWIALLDESGELVTAVEAGAGKTFSKIVNKLKHGELTSCGQKALSQMGTCAIEDRSSTCSGCPLSKKCAGSGAMAIRLEYLRKTYGMICVSIPSDLTADKEEQMLFEEIAGDIAFALHNLEVESERKKTEEALHESQERLQLLIKNAHDASYSLQTAMKP